IRRKRTGSAAWAKCAGTLLHDKESQGGLLQAARLTEASMAIAFDSPVDQVMSGWPATIRVFLDFRMGCVGCPIACFHTVDDACREHGVDRNAFLNALRSVVAEATA